MKWILTQLPDGKFRLQADLVMPVADAMRIRDMINEAETPPKTPPEPMSGAKTQEDREG